jgi:16S rRNA (cytosine967-C5)-methyltransferase
MASETRSSGASAAAASAGGPSAARACALSVVRRTFEGGAYTDRAMHAASRGLDPRDRALAMRLAYGAVQRRLTLDHVIELLSDRSIDAIDPPLRASLRVGLYELLWCDSASHAVVHDTVELAKSSRGHGLANAVLRRATREGAGLIAGLDDRTPEAAAVAHSMPLWIVELWWAALGADAARVLLARCNEPAEHALRANMIVTDAARLAADLPVAASVPGDPPEAVIALERFDAHASDLWRAGAFMPQSRAAMLVGHVVDPQPGERILDLCAAPGGKATHLAALVGPTGEVVAVERHAGRARALGRTVERMRATNVTVVVGDAGRRPAGEGVFDRVLLDPPCSGLGTLQSRPDLRWRASPESVAGLAAEQARLLSVAAGAVAAGGRLVYSTCTISPAENERQIDVFLADHADFEPVDLQPGFPAWASGPAVLALPSVQGSDGFFIAALRRG